VILSEVIWEAVTGGRVSRRRLRRKTLYRLLARYSEYISVTASYGRFIVRSADHGVGEALFASHNFEDFETLQSTVAICRTEGKLGMDVSDRLFVEVGANIGTTTIPALSVLGFGRALALEPEASNARLLRVNLVLNGLSDRCQVHEVAAGAVPATATLWVGRDNHGDHRLWNLAGIGLQANAATSSVIVCTLDDLVPDESSVGLVWIDTQGYEGFVLAGANSLWRSGVPFLLEFWPDGMVAAGSWASFEGFATSAEVIFDLRSGRRFPNPSAEDLSQLALEYSGIGNYSDLLLWSRTVTDE
jgi:FkbM family methyltransferase